MGCFRVMCLITGLPIKYGEEAYFVPIVKIGMKQEREMFVESDDRWKMELPIIKGTYDDYGNLEIKNGTYEKEIETYLFNKFYFTGKAQELSDGVDRTNLKLEFTKKDFDLIPFCTNEKGFDLRILISAILGSRIELKIVKKVKNPFEGLNKETELSGFFVKKSIIDEYKKITKLEEETAWQRRNEFYTDREEFKEEYEEFKLIKQLINYSYKPIVPAMYGSQWVDSDVLKIIKNEYEVFIKGEEEDE